MWCLLLDQSPVDMTDGQEQDVWKVTRAQGTFLAPQTVINHHRTSSASAIIDLQQEIKYSFIYQIHIHNYPLMKHVRLVIPI